MRKWLNRLLIVGGLAAAFYWLSRVRCQDCRQAPDIADEPRIMENPSGRGRVLEIGGARHRAIVPQVRHQTLADA